MRHCSDAPEPIVSIVKSDEDRFIPVVREGGMQYKDGPRAIVFTSYRTQRREPLAFANPPANVLFECRGASRILNAPVTCPVAVVTSRHDVAAVARPPLGERSEMLSSAL